MASFWDNLWYKYKQGNIVTKMLYINVAVFLFLKLFLVFAALFRVDGQLIVRYLQLPADRTLLCGTPWTLITYMFVHEGFLHLLFNMLWLYFFGRFFINSFSTRQFLWVYFLGGVLGGLFYVSGYNFFPLYQETLSFSLLSGASASILALTLAIAFYRPNEHLNLLFIGPIKLKWLAVIVVVMDLLSLAGENAGGSLAHLGGAFFGLLFGLMAGQGKALFSKENPFLFSSLRKKKNRSGKKYHRAKEERIYDVDQAYRNQRKREEDKRDAILDKIKQSGYDSLTAEEKKFLFQESKNSY